MAKMYPSLIDSQTVSQAEIKLFHIFKDKLGESWVVFHNVKRIWRYDNITRDGEADFIIAHSDFGVLVLEVKGGGIRFDRAMGHYFSKDRNGNEHDIKDPFGQAQENKRWLIDYMKKKSGWPKGRIILGHAVAFPDAIIEDDWLHPNAPAEIIIDFLSLGKIETKVKHVLRYFQDAKSSPPGRNGLRALEENLGLSSSIRNPLLSEKSRRYEEEVLKLTENQYRLLRGVEPYSRVIIEGCAGAGKTVLAVETATRFAKDGLRVLYVCFNEALADFIGKGLKKKEVFDVHSYHSLVKRWRKLARLPFPDARSIVHDRHEFFEDILPDLFLGAVERVEKKYDAVIVDEMQDFNLKWWESLFFLLADEVHNTFYAFADDCQRIFPAYGKARSESAAKGFTRYSLPCNCRNTKEIASLASKFYTGKPPPEIGGAEGPPVEFHEYSGFKKMCSVLGDALVRMIEREKVNPEDIVVLTPRHSKVSDLVGPPTDLPGLKLLNFELSGIWPLKKGQIYTKSVYSFKGLERGFVIICEIDDQIPEDDLQVLLYAAISRAKYYLILLFDRDTPKSIKAKLSSDKR